MGQKALAWIVLTAFSLFSLSCYSWRREPLQSIPQEKRTGTEVSAIQTKAGNKVSFHPPARITADSVAGDGRVYSLRVDKTKIKEPRDLNVPPPFELSTTDGSLFRVSTWASIKEAEDKILITGSLLTLPLADIDFVSVKKANVGAVLVVIAIPVFLGVLIFSQMTLSFKPHLE